MRPESFAESTTLAIETRTEVDSVGKVIAKAVVTSHGNLTVTKVGFLSNDGPDGWSITDVNDQVVSVEPTKGAAIRWITNAATTEAARFAANKRLGAL